MIFSSVVTVFATTGLGFLLVLLQDWLQTTYIDDFLSENLIALLVALLAINSATMGVVLTKLRDLVDYSRGHQLFSHTRRHMLHSVHEQITLIVAALLVLVVDDSNLFDELQNAKLLLRALSIGVFLYAIWILYDTAKGVLIIVDFEVESSAESSSDGKPSEDS